MPIFVGVYLNGQASKRNVVETVEFVLWAISRAQNLLPSLVCATFSDENKLNMLLSSHNQNHVIYSRVLRRIYTLTETDLQ